MLVIFVQFDIDFIVFGYCENYESEKGENHVVPEIKVFLSGSQLLILMHSSYKYKVDLKTYYPPKHSYGSFSDVNFDFGIDS